MAATAMSTVSMSIVGAYMTMLEPKYVVAALVLNMFSTFIVLSLINPYRVDASEENIQMSNLHEGQSFFEMLGEYILAGFKVAIIVAAMLIGFIALIAALNALFATVTGWFGYSISFQGILGYIFYPIAWVMGVPSSEALQVGSIMATKLVSNEFVAMMDLQKIASTLSPRAEGIISVFPNGFLYAIGYAGLAATIWAAIVPALLARASRKRFGSPKFRVWGGKPMIALILVFGVGNALVHILSSFNLLPVYQ
eukprot:364162_1